MGLSWWKIAIVVFAVIAVAAMILSFREIPEYFVPLDEVAFGGLPPGINQQQYDKCINECEMRFNYCDGDNCGVQYGDCLLACIKGECLSDESCDNICSGNKVGSTCATSILIGGNCRWQSGSCCSCLGGSISLPKVRDRVNQQAET
jgi:hypothetical protein